MTRYAIGDIQGCLQAFDALLSKLAFDPVNDRLWLVGDLVNRGPHSVGVLRRVMELGDGTVCVLGNHDLHLLATSIGIRAPTDNDTFGDVLDAPDRDMLLDWLRRRPLLHYDRASATVLVHAGIPPLWTLEQASREAARVEAHLGSEDWANALREMYGNSPRGWSDDLNETDKRRYTINALTRMRYVDADGNLELTEHGPPGTQAPGLVPWFDWPRRRRLECRVVFGHWSALGLLLRHDLLALDSGCVWGRVLTAVDLDDPSRQVQVACKS